VALNGPANLRLSSWHSTFCHTQGLQQRANTFMFYMHKYVFPPKKGQLNTGRKTTHWNSQHIDIPSSYVPGHLHRACTEPPEHTAHPGTPSSAHTKSGNYLVESTDCLPHEAATCKRQSRVLHAHVLSDTLLHSEAAHRGVISPIHSHQIPSTNPQGDSCRLCAHTHTVFS